MLFRSPIDYKLKNKIMLDASKGIKYLHDNGILHRDIKPDNFLCVSLEENMNVNAKLTDFGASRNINLLMTNMTFTKGIGTPIYMAPEILDKKKYKKPADIYSFSITMFEFVGWCHCYEGDKFKYPWNIADFVSAGQRVPRRDSIPENVFDIIEKCWTHEPKNRIDIDELIKQLESIY